MPTTRLPDLIEHGAINETGQSLGRVHDLRMRRDGRPATLGATSPTVLALIIGAGAVGRLLGYTDPD